MKVLRRVVIRKVDLCRMGANPEADIKLFKSRDIAPEVPPTVIEKENPTVPKPSKPVDTADPAAVQVYIDALEKSLTGAETELTELKKERELASATPEDLLKSLPESHPIRKMVEKAVADKTASDAKLAETNEKLEKSAQQAEFVALSKSIETNFSKLPGTVEALAKMFQEAKAVLTAASYEVMETVMKAGNAAIAKATEELGGNRPVSTSGSALDELNRRADAMVESKVAKTRPDAMQKVAEADPALYARYKEEKRTVR